MKSVFSMNWLRSIQPRKQRKFRHNAPSHIRGRFLSAPLSKDLKKKYDVNSVRVRSGDTVTVLRGQFKGKSGAVDRVDVSREKIYVVGVETIKKDGAKSLYPIHASNVVVTAVVSDDKKRFKTSATKKEIKESN